MIATEPWFKGQQGALGRVAGGWTFAPIFTAGSGAPVYCNTNTDGQAWGGGDATDYFDNEQCVFNTPYNGGHSAHFGVTGSGGVGDDVLSTPSVNLFKNPVSVWNQVRAPILGIDTKNPGQGPFTGQTYWNLDAQVKKNIRILESATFEFSFISTNILNHRIFNDPYLALNDSTDWGVISTQLNTPRKMEFGLRAEF
jgi:hypothetical protein